MLSNYLFIQLLFHHTANSATIQWLYSCIIMFEEFLKSDRIFSTNDQRSDNSKFITSNPATITAINTATTVNTATTATTIKDVQMDDIATPTIEATSTDTKSFYSPHVWKQIRLNLDETFHCVETANYWAKNQPDLQWIMHELNALKNNQPIKKHHSKSINPNQKILAKIAKMKKKQEEFQNKWNSVLVKINIVIITIIIIIFIIIIISIIIILITIAKTSFYKKTWTQIVVLKSSKDFVFTLIKKKIFSKQHLNPLPKHLFGEKKESLLCLINLKCKSISWIHVTKSIRHLKMLRFQSLWQQWIKPKIKNWPFSLLIRTMQMN